MSISRSEYDERLRRIFGLNDPRSNCDRGAGIVTNSMSFFARDIFNGMCGDPNAGDYDDEYEEDDY